MTGHNSLDREGGPLPFHEIFAFVIDKLNVQRAHPTRRLVSYEELFRRCSAIESRLKVARPYFTGKKEATVRKAIQRLRDIPKYAVPGERQAIVAEALGLPLDFFSNKYDFDQVRDAYDRSRQAPTPSDTAMRPRNFPQAPSAAHIPRTRLKAAKELADLYGGAVPETGTILLLEGPAMVGKSYFLAHWARDHVAGEYLPALLVDCSALSLDQIIPSIASQLGDLDGFRASGNLPKLLVLDGLRLRNFREGAVNDRSSRNAPRLSDLFDLAIALTEVGPKILVVLVMENDGAPISDDLISTLLPDRLTAQHRHIAPLDREESEKLFGAYLTQRLPEPLVRDAAAKMGGMPIALIAEAGRANDMGAVAYETSMRRMAVPLPYRMVEMGDYFRSRYPASEGEDQDENDLHNANPLALLRLLALMPGPVSSRDLSEIIRQVGIRRLGQFADLDRLTRGLPFVFRVEGSYDLHALAREHFASELDSFVENDQYDAHTSRDELLHIHWKAAAIAWRLLSEDVAADRLTVASVWHFAYHVLRMIKLLPGDMDHPLGDSSVIDGRYRQTDPNISDQQIKEFLLSPLALSPRELWNFAYVRAARPYLLDKGKSATRLHGQFEAKARIIEALVPSGPDAGMVPPRVLVELLFEAAVCWMHSGRLQSAGTSLQLALRALRKLHPSIWNFAKSIKGDTSGQDAEDWRVITSLASLQAVLGIRMGRHGDETRADLSPFVETSQNLLSDFRNGTIGKSGHSLVQGAVRIVSRWAELELYAGNLVEARSFYEEALSAESTLEGAPQQSSDRPHVSGERARRYVALLLRGSNGPSDLNLAMDIVDRNIRALEADAERRGLSNDIVPFYVMRAAVRRALGDRHGAQSALASARTFDSVRQRHCTYVSLLEIELEAIRQQIAYGDKPKAIADSLKSFIARADGSHHLLLACDARILEIESKAEDERPNAVRHGGILLRQFGYLMRMSDLDVISQGQSAVGNHFV